MFQVPESGRVDIVDITEGYIISPGYPGNYPDRSYGSIEITTSSKMVGSLINQSINPSINQSMNRSIDSSINQSPE